MNRWKQIGAVVVLGSCLALLWPMAKAATSQQPSAAVSSGPALQAVFPNTDDGKPIMQLGLEGWHSNTVMQPFLNLTRVWGVHADGPWVAEGPGKKPMVFRDLWNAGFIDRATLLPTAIPPGYEKIRSDVFRYGARYYPEYFAGSYVLEWEGEADLRFGFGHREQRRNGNNVTGKFSERDNEWMNVEITRIGQGGLKSINIYRKEYEARVKAGEFWDPDYLNHVRRYKVIRSLDVQAPNVASARSIGGLMRKEHAVWGLSASLDPATPDAPTGQAIEPLFDLAVASDTALWMHVAGLIGAGPEFDQYSLKVEGDKAGMKTLAAEKGREIIESEAWDEYAREIVRSLITSGYPKDRMLYIEVGNELWNNAHPFWWLGNYYAGIGQAFNVTEALGLAQNFGGGVATARFTLAMDKALRDAGRTQTWMPVLAGQMAWTEPARSSLNGFKYYLQENNIDPAPYLARSGVTVASYYFGALEAQNGVIRVPTYADGSMSPENEALLKTKWLAAIKADPEGLAQKTADWYFAQSPVQGNFAWIIKQRAAHQALAESNGAQFIGDYEGESHETGGVVRLLEREPVFVNWYENLIAGPHGERITKGWAEALIAQNSAAIIANYKSIGVRDPQGDSPNDSVLEKAWTDGFYNEDIGRMRALDAYLRD